MTKNGGNIVWDYRFDPSLELTIFTATINSIYKFEINPLKTGYTTGNFLSWETND